MFDARNSTVTVAFTNGNRYIFERFLHAGVRIDKLGYILQKGEVVEALKLPVSVFAFQLQDIFRLVIITCHVHRSQLKYLIWI